ncbi:MAG TPA: hypothetical protein VIC05_06185 [Solirubrobacteraceae bacterium]|jgi:hypothetical protein
MGAASTIVQERAQPPRLERWREVHHGASLARLTGNAQTLAFVGLAKNTGKTVALRAILSELGAQGVPVGVTSVGRDGEERDVIDIRIEKPRVHLPAGSLLATTDRLLRASGLAHRLLLHTGIRTPLGGVVLARLLTEGAIEIAGPSTRSEIRAVAEAMLAHGAERVLIDGAIDRRAASSPDTADGLVMCTGAVLGRDPLEVVARTREAAQLACLAQTSSPSVRAHAAVHDSGSFLFGERGSAQALPARFALTVTEREVRGLLDANPQARSILVNGAVCETFLQALAEVAGGRELEVVAPDSTKVFLARSCEYYRRRAITISVLRPTRLLALTINPLAPASHRMDSTVLREAIQEVIPGVPVLDVLDRPGPLQLAA